MGCHHQKHSFTLVTRGTQSRLQKQNSPVGYVHRQVDLVLSESRSRTEHVPNFFLLAIGSTCASGGHVSK